MPIVRGFDNEGCFYRYGETGEKYHYKCGNEEARQRAYEKAREQEIAIISSGYNGLINMKSYTDYPQAATENAKIALRWAEENGWGSCGTPVGKIRANQLANREPLSRDTIARMAAFERHRQNSQKELGDGCGRLMWLAWGGDEGIEWAQRKLEQIDRGTDLINLKKWRSNASSSNVDRIMFNDETNELVIKFNSGDIYTYYDINFGEFEDIFRGNGICRTSGENRWGSWEVGKTPSVGAAVYSILVRRGARYTRGGSLR